MSRVRHLSELKCVPNPAVVEMLEKLLQSARDGHLLGFTALLNYGSECGNTSAGETSFTDLIAAFEDWKFNRLASRNLKA